MSESRYLVTALKYRPQTFSELVSQEHVSATLRNAIRLDRLAHAYLFSGPRGVGKTTAARILAKAINCTTPLSERDQGEPCRRCDSCRTVEEGRSLNIIEIDAASNNSVDDVRALREKVLVPPQGARKKVYIVDEVHMLSNAAFNALLKTLEEPPPHILFIFATTEPHKVLPTILSRCQRFDFRRIAVDEIVARLKDICQNEAIEADEAALMLIGKRGDGALRDALSVFDQAVSLIGTNLAYADLAEALGVVSVDLYFEVTDAVKRGDRPAMLRLVQTLVERGFDFQEFLSGLVEHLRNLLVAATTGSTDLIETDRSTRDRYEATARDFEEPDLLRLLMMVDAAEYQIRNSPQPRLKLEMTLLKMSHLARSADLDTLLKALADLPDGDASSGIAGGSGTGSTTRTPSAASAAGTAGQSVSSSPADTPTPASQVSIDSRAGRTQGPRAAAPERTASGRPSIFPLGVPALQRQPDAGRKVAPGPPAGEEERVGFAGSGALSTAPAPRRDPHFGSSLHHVREAWDSFVLEVTRDRIHVGAMLQHAEPAAVDNEVLKVSVPDEFHRRLLSNQADYLRGQFGRVMEDTEPPHLRFVINNTLSDSATLTQQEEFDPFEHLKALRQENPIIRAIFDQFGGEPVW